MHYLEISALSTKDEGNIDKITIAESIKEELDNLISKEFTTDFKKNKITSVIETLEPELKDFETIYKVNIKLEKKPEEFLKIITNKLNESDKKFLIETLDSRIDDKCQFYLRIKLNEFIEKQKFALTDEGDCIHFKAKIAAYPASKENATKIIQELIE